MTTTRAIIDELGGAERPDVAVAAMLDVTPAAVRHWQRLNRFPRYLRARLAALCSARGVVVPPSELYGGKPGRKRGTSAHGKAA